MHLAIVVDHDGRVVIRRDASTEAGAERVKAGDRDDVDFSQEESMLRPTLALCFVVLAASCGGSGLDISTWQAPQVAAGPASAVRVVDGEGVRASESAAEGDALTDLANAGVFHAVDDTRATLTVVDGKAQLDDGRSFQAGSLYLRLDVLEDFAEISQEARDGVDQDGNAVTVLVDVTHAHAVVAATLVRADGSVALDRTEVDATHDEDGDVEDEAQDAAMNDAVAKIVDEITPKHASDFVPFDDRDEGERAILSEAEGGDVDSAVRAEDAYIAAHEKLAAPRYNRAVMLDSQCHFDEAIAGYDDAKAHAPDEKLASMIDEARAGCIERRDVARSVGVR